MARWVSTERLAAWSIRRPWLVVGIWAVLFVLAGVSASGVGDVLTTKMRNYDGKDSTQADHLIERHFGTAPNREFVVVQSDSRPVTDPAFKALVESLTASLREMRTNVASVTNTFESGDPSLISTNGQTTLIPVVLKGDQPADAVAPVLKLVEEHDGKDGFTVVTGGDGSIAEAFNTTSESDLQTAEMIGLPVALLVLVVVFGAVVAAGVPIGLSFLSIFIAVGITALIGRAFELSTFVMNMITMIGLAVGIDYSLLIVQRFREERRRGVERDEAITHAGATASRAVLFSGLTVIVALAGLLIVPNNIFRSLSVGAITVVVVTIAAALTLLPAVLRLLGDRVDRLRVRIPGRAAKPVDLEHERGFWAFTTRLVTNHPVISIAASVVLLTAASLPYFGIDLGSSSVTSLPKDTSAARAFGILNSEFNAGLLTPARVVVEADDVNSPKVQEAVKELERAFSADTALGRPTVQMAPTGNLAIVTVPIAGDPEAEPAHQAINRIREEYVPGAFRNGSAEAFVTGQTAATDDFNELINEYTPIVFSFVLGLSFVILLVVFRSIVVPIKAIIMNLLSVGAAYGLMVLVIQDGVGNELFGFEKAARIDAWIPLFMFAVLFGLSMDYHVFLLTRIRERFDQTHNNLASVSYGVRTTAGMITGAALIMVSVFAGFAAGQLTSFQQVGFGLAVAIILDATIVRVVLVPASMALLGDLNWYLPSWLGWLPRVNVEGSAVGAEA